LVILKNSTFDFAFLLARAAASLVYKRTASTPTGNASLRLDYAEDLRRKLEAGILRPETAPEGPHNTTEVLSAREVYHRKPLSGIHFSQQESIEFP
jgi:hypothetical protein